MDNKQFKKLHLGIVTGGGNASILSEGKFDPDLLLQENTCFIEPVKTQLVTEESKDFLKNIISTLQTKNLRMIPESDIGLAVAYASTEKFCNPRFDIGSAVLGPQRIPSQSLTEREVYVPDTQESVKRAQPSIMNFLNSSSSGPKSKKQKTLTGDSFNLTSFKEDPDDILEIPLSAEVKRELDNIFDVAMDDAEESDQNGEEVESTLQADQVTEVKTNVPESTKTKTTPKNENSLKKPKIEANTSLVNGFTTTINGDNEENLPRNLITVKFASLVVRKPVLPSVQQNANSHVKNFKKFKKVLPLKAQALPRIIGAHELIPYDKDAAKFAEDWNDEPEVINTRPVRGAFDWESQDD